MKIIRLSNMAGFTSAPLNTFSIFRVKHYSDEYIKYAAFHPTDEELMQSISLDPQIPDRLEVKDAGGSIMAYLRMVRNWAKNTTNDTLVVHGHQPGSSVVGLFALILLGKKIPFIYTVHNSMQNFPLLKKALLFMCFFRADRITFVSQSAFDSFRPALSKNLLKKSIVIQNGVDFERVDNALEGLAFGHQSSDGFINIACIGRLTLQKNLPFLIRVVSQLPKNVRLDIFGVGSLRVDLQQQIDEADLQDRVVLRGNIPRDDLFRFLNNADLYVSVAYYEGLPMALMEALAVGRPCLVSDIQPHHEIKKLVPSLEVLPCEVALWMEGIQQMIAKNPTEREQLGKQNRSYVKESLTMRRMQDKYREIYETVTNARKDID